MTTQKYKSKLEQKFAKQFPHLPYETNHILYTIEHTYTPDFKVNKDIYLETKGLWTSSDRSKIRAVLEQNPAVIICLVFQNSNNRLSKASKTSYGAYCTKHNIPWFNSTDIAGIKEWIALYS